MATKKVEEITLPESVKVGGYVFSSASVVAVIVYLFPQLQEELVLVITPFLMAGVNVAMVVVKNLLKKKGLL